MVTLTCSDVTSGAAGHGIAGRARARGPTEHVPKLSEPSACPIRFRVAGRFVRVERVVVPSIRFCLRAGASWRRMDREASTKGTAAPSSARAETCGGVRVRGPISGDGAQSPVHYLDAAG